MVSIEDLRNEYSKAKLDAANVSGNPITQFEKWFTEARESAVPEPNAMSLATVSGSGRPSSRIVLLKSIENDGFVFYTNYQSQKGKDLAENAACALNFFWPELERQVRIEGIASPVPEDKSTAYFQARPRASQVGAWASPQSHIIASRDILEERAQQIDMKYRHLNALPKPKQWGGYKVEPYLVEFWQGRASRLHDRIVYTRSGSGWTIGRLAP